MSSINAIPKSSALVSTEKNPYTCLPCDRVVEPDEKVHGNPCGHLFYCEFCHDDSELGELEPCPAKCPSCIKTSPFSSPTYSGNMPDETALVSTSQNVYRCHECERDVDHGERVFPNECGCLFYCQLCRDDVETGDTDECPAKCRSCA